MPKNVVVAQSGGPSPVINNSLRGVIEGCRACPDTYGCILGGWHGIEGILKEELIDLSCQLQRELDLLATTPSAGSIGTCRYKIKDHDSPDVQRALDVFAAHEVGYFFYIGGNDSMDTAQKLSDVAATQGMQLICTGVPKTIDNDIGDQEFALIDHSPGFGSVARYWACVAQNMNEENAGFSPAGPVLVMQTMGRTAGFIPASVRLSDPERRWPMHIYMSESGLDLKDLADLVNDEIRKNGRCLVVVSEGFDVGDVGAVHDSFGHIEYSASRTTVAQVVLNHLHDVGLSSRGWAQLQIPGCDQRSTSIFASTVDLDEAFKVGRHATEIARREGSGWMSTILREPGETYRVWFDKVPLTEVANHSRRLPESWIAKNRIDVTDAFIDYARPLIGDEWAPIALENGLQRFARFKRSFVEKKCERYVPMGHHDGRP